MPSKLSLETATPVAILSCSEAYRTAFGEHYLKGQDRMLKGNGGKEAVTTQDVGYSPTRRPVAGSHLGSSKHSPDSAWASS
jgi:hypothetical protein